LDFGLRSQQDKFGAKLGALSEQFMKADQIPKIAREADSLGADVILYRNGKPFIGLEFKTGRIWSIKEEAQYTSRFVLPFLQIQP
jgi:hypothetical protein